MEAFPFKTDSKSDAFCRLIAKDMVKLFDIPEAEALQRVGTFWSHLPEIIGEQDMVYHETEDFWAKTIYYGAGSYWWITGSERDRRHLKPLKPKPLN